LPIANCNFFATAQILPEFKNPAGAIGNRQLAIGNVRISFTIGFTGS
jgi:hypothetical protein